MPNVRVVIETDWFGGGVKQPQSRMLIRGINLIYSGFSDSDSAHLALAASVNSLHC
jgi:hypothetical protein